MNRPKKDRSGRTGLPLLQCKNAVGYMEGRFFPGFREKFGQSDNRQRVYKAHYIAYDQGPFSYLTHIKSQKYYRTIDKIQYCQKAHRDTGLGMEFTYPGGEPAVGAADRHRTQAGGDCGVKGGTQRKYGAAYYEKEALAELSLR